MMLVDGNLDGAISPEELQKVINFVKAQQKNETIETWVWKPVGISLKISR